MASPVVSGTIALMLQANPALTPNLVKAILQYTAESKRRYDGLTQGGGFLNARGAVELARALAGGEPLATSRQNDPTRWSGHIVWGNHRLGGGLLVASANAWRTDVLWGSATTPDGTTSTWGQHVRGGTIAATRQRRQRPTRTSCGARSRTARTSSGARARPPRTSCGDGVRRRRLPNIVWGTTAPGDRRAATRSVWPAEAASPPSTAASREDALR